VAPGAALTVGITYRGRPRTMPGPDGPTGWEELTDGVLVAAQPCGAPSWFPCNDRPDDKARYRIDVTASEAYRVVANGVLDGRARRAGRITWRYRQEQPMAPYLAVLHVGRYATTPVAAGVEIIHPPGLRVGRGTAFAGQADMLSTFVELFGPYPFDEYRAVITADVLEIPLEAQSLATFGANHVVANWDNERLVAHELAHQWFGNSLTVADWRHIWLNEGFAQYAEWLWSEISGAASAQSLAEQSWAGLAQLPQDLLLAEPGVPNLFDDRVYQRGALTLHALRGTVGDRSFFALLRDWAGAYRHGTVRTEDLTALAQRHTATPLDTLFREWLWQPRLPPLPRAVTR